jgi:hypothetical protein
VLKLHFLGVLGGESVPTPEELTVVLVLCGWMQWLVRGCAVQARRFEVLKGREGLLMVNDLDEGI